MVSSRIDASRSNENGSMKLRNVAYRPPAVPANAPASAAAETLARSTFLPAAATASLVLADRAQQAAERRAHDQPEAPGIPAPTPTVHSSTYCAVRLDRHAEQVGRRDAGQAVGAAGAGGPVGEHRRRQQLDAERGHHEIIAGHAQRRQRDQDVQRDAARRRDQPATGRNDSGSSPSGNARRYRRRRRTPRPGRPRRCRRCRPAGWWTGRAAHRSRPARCS